MSSHLILVGVCSLLFCTTQGSSHLSLRYINPPQYKGVLPLNLQASLQTSPSQQSTSESNSTNTEVTLLSSSEDSDNPGEVTVQALQVTESIVKLLSQLASLLNMGDSTQLLGMMFMALCLVISLLIPLIITPFLLLLMVIIMAPLVYNTPLFVSGRSLNHSLLHLILQNVSVNS